MKYTVSITIDKPIDYVIEKFDDPDNLKHWQKGLQSFELTEGKEGEIGSKYLIKYKMGKREMDMVETIVERNLPENFAASYEAKGMWNLVDNHFSTNEAGGTLLTSHNTFKPKGFMKVMMFLMPGLFKKQSMKFLKAFKAFAEDGTSVLEG